MRASTVQGEVAQLVAMEGLFVILLFKDTNSTIPQSLCDSSLYTKEPLDEKSGAIKR